ncbi:MAG: hypothetical protein Q9160_002412 [Pyrenula sp. 1 TL-2023]
MNEGKTWLSNELALAESLDTAAVSGHIRLVVVDYNPVFWIQNRCPYSSVMDLLDVLEIPRNAYTVDDIVQSHVFPPTLDECSVPLSTQILSRSVACGDSGIAWKFHRKTLTSTGVAWSTNEEGREEIEYILDKVVHLQPLLTHPSILGLLALQAMTLSMREWVEAKKEQVHQAQIKSGYHQYARVESGTTVGNINYGKMSASVSGLAANLVTSEICLRGLHHLATSILEDNHSFTNDQSLAGKGDVRQAADYIGRQARFWGQECANLQADAAAWQRKASLVIQGIFNLIAQRDQNTSIGIAKDSRILAEQSQKIAYESRVLAEESKRDSTSMKAIAAVTVFFLPGTFVASLFAMLMFQWDAQAGSIVNHHFWLYWAVTIPLTITTILTWLTWDLLSNKQRKAVSGLIQGEMEKTTADGTGEIAATKSTVEKDSDIQSVGETEKPSTHQRQDALGPKKRKRVSFYNEQSSKSKRLSNAAAREEKDANDVFGRDAVEKKESKPVNSVTDTSDQMPARSSDKVLDVPTSTDQAVQKGDEKPSIHHQCENETAQHSNSKKSATDPYTEWLIRRDEEIGIPVSIYDFAQEVEGEEDEEELYTEYLRDLGAIF